MLCGAFFKTRLVFQKAQNLTFWNCLCYVLLALVLLAACVERQPPAEPVATVVDHSAFWYDRPAWSALALLETGENPIWFEFTSGGPAHIQSPGIASLAPYTPWPHARFAGDIMLWQGFLVMAVNTDGFLVLGPAAGAENTKVILYRVAASELWTPYTIGSFFTWRDQPAVLLYRNDFFSELYPLSPLPQVFALDKFSPVPIGVEVPALTRVPPGESWEVETLRLTSDGYWYYRMREKGGTVNRSAYFRARDLEGEGERISHAQWRNSELPETPRHIPPPLSAMLGVLGMDEAGAAFTLKVLSAGVERTRFFRAAADGADSTRLYAFYDENLALLIFPDGRGLYSRGTDIQPITLPPLPEGFVYTGIAVLGGVVLASWEEQQGVGLGAAGFMARSAF